MKKLIIILLLTAISAIGFAQITPAPKFNNANFYGGIWVRDSIWGAGKLKFTGTTDITGASHYLSIGAQGFATVPNNAIPHSLFWSNDGTGFLINGIYDPSAIGSYKTAGMGWYKNDLSHYLLARADSIEVGWYSTNNNDSTGFNFNLTEPDGLDYRMVTPVSYPNSYSVWMLRPNGEMSLFAMDSSIVISGKSQCQLGWDSTLSRLKLYDGTAWRKLATTEDVNNISLTPGPTGPTGPTGPQGASGQLVSQYYKFPVMAGATNPSDAQTYYFGNSVQTMTTTAGQNKIYMRHTDTLVIADITMYAITVAGTNEDVIMYVTKNGTTDYLIDTVSVAGAERVFLNTSMVVPFAVNDWYEFKLVCPTWATNPTGVKMQGATKFKTRY